MAFVALGALSAASMLTILLLVVTWRVHIDRMDELVLGQAYPIDSYALRLWRLTDYGFASISNWCARRTLPHVDFTALPQPLVRRLQAVGGLYIVFVASSIGMVIINWLGA